MSHKNPIIFDVILNLARNDKIAMNIFTAKGNYLTLVSIIEPMANAQWKSPITGNIKFVLNFIFLFSPRPLMSVLK
jgi:hypothetical protein